MSEIFRHLYEFDNKGEIGFEYSVKYEISGTETEITWKGGKLSINGKARKTIGDTPLPDNVLIYYSGHNDTVSGLVQPEADYYHSEPCVGGSKIVFKSDGEKTTFAKEVVPTLDAACFEVFRPMFEFIKSKCVGRFAMSDNDKKLIGSVRNYVCEAYSVLERNEICQSNIANPRS